MLQARQSRRLAQEKPCVSVRASSACRPQRKNQQPTKLHDARAVPAIVAEPTSDDGVRQFADECLELGRGYRFIEASDEAAYSFIQDRTRTSSPFPPSTPAQQQVRAPQSLDVPPPLPYRARGSGIPPPVQ